MNIQTKEKLVLLIISGTDTYESICDALPELSESELYYAAHTHLEEERLLTQITEFIRNPAEEYHFQPNDRFELAEAGKNILYLLEKDASLREKQAQAVRYAKLSFIATVIIGTTTILLAGIPLIWRYLFP